MKKQFLVLLFVGITMTAAIISLRPVPILPEERLSIIYGTIDQIFEAGDLDIVFTLKENGESYYINRGLEQGLSIEDLKQKLEGEKVTIKYPEYWSLLQSDEVKHMSKLIFKDQVIYTEVKSDLVTKN